MIYCGASTAIAALERYVHTGGVVPEDLVLVRVDLPDGCSEESAPLATLPIGWDLVPPGRASMELGTTWAQSKRSLALVVPSALLPEERNVILNPNHREFANVEMHIVRRFSFDRRMAPDRRGRLPRKAKK